jgi:hypothetical protein
VSTVSLFIALPNFAILGNILFFFREVHNILTFSLDTAEQSLHEIQPHVVMKLVENRTKRLKALEKLQREIKGDLDQRSKDTCLISSSHLEDFVTKAEKKHRECVEESAVSMQQLRSLLLAVSTYAAS